MAGAVAAAYAADPVAEEMQLLRQLAIEPAFTNSRKTMDVAERLCKAGLVMTWWDMSWQMFGVEIAKAGIDRLHLGGDWMQTFTGRRFYPLNPDPAQIDIEDIAAALSKMCRYNGHVRRFYSVAEHCVLLCRYVAPVNRRWALLHDASEAYLADIVRPAKRGLPEYRAVEARLMAAVCARFGLPPVMPDEVADADNRVLNDEREQALGPIYDGPGWSVPGGPLGVTLQFWEPARAQQEFLYAFWRGGAA